MATTPEGNIKDLIKKWAKKNNIWLFMPIPSAYGKNTGMSDFLGCISGVFLAIEAKAPGKKSTTTPNQQKFLDSVRTNGGVGIVVDSQEDLDELDIILAREGIL